MRFELQNETPFIMAVVNGTVKTIEEELKVNPELITVPARNGLAPLAIALGNEHVAVAALLIKHKAKPFDCPDVGEYKGQSAFSIAVEKRDWSLARKLLGSVSETEVKSIFLDWGSLQILISSNQLDIVRSFWKFSLNANATIAQVRALPNHFKWVLIQKETTPSVAANIPPFIIQATLKEEVDPKTVAVLPSRIRLIEAEVDVPAKAIAAIQSSVRCLRVFDTPDEEVLASIPKTLQELLITGDAEPDSIHEVTRALPTVKVFVQNEDSLFDSNNFWKLEADVLSGTAGKVELTFDTESLIRLSQALECSRTTNNVTHIALKAGCARFQKDNSALWVMPIFVEDLDLLLNAAVQRRVMIAFSLSNVILDNACVDYLCNFVETYTQLESFELLNILPETVTILKPLSDSLNKVLARKDSKLERLSITCHEECFASNVLKEGWPNLPNAIRKNKTLRQFSFNWNCEYKDANKSLFDLLDAFFQHPGLHELFLAGFEFSELAERQLLTLKKRLEENTGLRSLKLETDDAEVNNFILMLLTAARLNRSLRCLEIIDEPIKANCYAAFNALLADNLYLQRLSIPATSAVMPHILKGLKRNRTLTHLDLTHIRPKAQITAPLSCTDEQGKCLAQSFQNNRALQFFAADWVLEAQSRVAIDAALKANRILTHVYYFQCSTSVDLMAHLARNQQYQAQLEIWWKNLAFLMTFERSNAKTLADFKPDQKKKYDSIQFTPILNSFLGIKQPHFKQAQSTEVLDLDKTGGSLDVDGFRKTRYFKVVTASAEATAVDTPAATVAAAATIAAAATAVVAPRKSNRVKRRKRLLSL